MKTVLHYVSNLAYSVFLAAVFLDYAVFWSYVYILITCVNVLSLVSANAVSLGLQCIVHCDEWICNILILICSSNLLAAL